MWDRGKERGVLYQGRFPSERGGWVGGLLLGTCTFHMRNVFK